MVSQLFRRQLEVQSSNEDLGLRVRKRDVFLHLALVVSFLRLHHHVGVGLLNGLSTGRRQNLSSRVLHAELAEVLVGQACIDVRLRLSAFATVVVS